MTEAEWRECIDPRRMLKLLPARGNERKLRLFACACVRRAARGLPRHVFPFGEHDQVAVDLIERCADGLAGKREFVRFLERLDALDGPGAEAEEAEEAAEVGHNDGRQARPPEGGRAGEAGPHTAEEPG